MPSTRRDRGGVRSVRRSIAPVLDPRPSSLTPRPLSRPSPAGTAAAAAAVRHRFPPGERRQLVLDGEGAARRLVQGGRSCSRAAAAFALQHVNTRRWLHSRNHASPISHNQEVSCFGGEDESNVDDDWRVETQGGDATWSRNKKVRLVHVSTQVALHSHNQRFGRPISGQFEVCGSRSRDSSQLWIAAEGIYLPSPGARGRQGRALTRARDVVRSPNSREIRVETTFRARRRARPGDTIRRLRTRPPARFATKRFARTRFPLSRFIGHLPGVLRASRAWSIPRCPRRRRPPPRRVVAPPPAPHPARPHPRIQPGCTPRSDLP